MGIYYHIPWVSYQRLQGIYDYTAGEVKATIANLPISADCTAGIIYQVLKDPNLKLTEITKLEEALARMEQVMARNSREPWEKHDCA